MCENASMSGMGAKPAFDDNTIFHCFLFRRPHLPSVFVDVVTHGKPMTLKKDSVWYRAIRVLHDPHSRYRYGKLTHAVRISLGILVAFGVTSGFDIPDGGWTPVSMLIVIAGLQHHGTIRQRATQRAFGTMVGVAAGLFVILQQKYLGCTPPHLDADGMVLRRLCIPCCRARWLLRDALGDYADHRCRPRHRPDGGRLVARH